MELQIFRYHNNDDMKNLTTVDVNGDPWFVASDVCKLLGLKNSRQAVSRLDDDEKNTVIINDGTSGNPNKTIISESGLYSLIFQSNKEEAKEFKRWITGEVLPSIRRTGSYRVEKYKPLRYIKRYNANWDRVDKGCFSVNGELFIRLYAKFEHNGYLIPDKALDGIEVRPDVSVGILFPKYLKKYHPELCDSYSMYSHRFPDGSEFDVRQYPNDVLPIFIRYIEEEWLPKHARAYFETRDPVALEYLPKLLA